MLNASALFTVFILDRTTLTSISVNLNVSSIQTAIMIMPKVVHDLIWKMSATVNRGRTGRHHESLTITVDVL